MQKAYEQEYWLIISKLLIEERGIYGVPNTSETRLETRLKLLLFGKLN